jgi:uncharacterized membrane protein YkvA (DUF1232 family)
MIMTSKKPVPVNPEKHVSMLTGISKQIKLVWALFTDGRVSLLTKAVIPISLLYVISPIDFIPDVFLGLGQLDDLGVLLLGMALFVKLCPPELVEFYLHKLEFGDNFYKDDDDETVDTTYRVVGED